MPHFHAEDERHADLVKAIGTASHLIATALKEGFQLMADAEIQALADLSDAITKLGAAITNEIAALQAALAKAGVDHSPDIESRVSQISALTNSLTNSIPGPTPTPAPTPAPAAPGA